VAERFFGRSKTSKRQRKRIFSKNNFPWPDAEGKFGVLCFECHEELLHNPVFLPVDINRFAKLVKQMKLNESKKPQNKDKIAERIVLLHEVIEKGLEALGKRG
jgi:hypothetical protein